MRSGEKPGGRGEGASEERRAWRTDAEGSVWEPWRERKREEEGEEAARS